ncbi:MAG: hypothetical protein HY674_12905 [Chloroflexi bacterium]|nr:hypothetical protein [Chloroflexota bacterium]
MSGPITGFPGYSGDVSWWNDWHYFVFQKKLTIKQIWIDGQLFLEHENTNPLPADFTQAYLGWDPPDNAAMRGIMDDLAVFATSLDEPTIGQLATGTLPNALPASTKLLAYWNFNDASVPPPTISIAKSGANVVVTYTGTLQSTDKIGGVWQDVADATSPYTVTPSATTIFFRAKQ